MKIKNRIWVDKRVNFKIDQWNHFCKIDIYSTHNEERMLLFKDLLVL